MENKGTILIKNGYILTMNAKRDILKGDIYVEDGRITAIGETPQSADQVIDAQGKLVLPGFIQTHVHLCQVLFRGLADDVDVVEWLKQRIWPYETAHDQYSINASAQLGIGEMIATGTTCALTMETTLNTDAVFDAISKTGFRSITGNAMMDVVEPGTEMKGLSSEDSYLETKHLFETWHGKDNGRIGYAVMPRGARNCSPALVERSRQLAVENGLIMHTHVSENGPLYEHNKKVTGLTDMELLEQQNWANDRLVIAHGVWLTDHDQEIIRNRGVKISHCPGANLKLASGFCQVPELQAQGISVSLGCDGAPCNNNLDMFNEMRLASLIHKPRCGPTAMKAYDVLEMATIEGARCLGLDKEIGSLEVGKKADIIVVDRTDLGCNPSLAVPFSAQIVYSMGGHMVDTTIIDGRVLYQNKEFTQTTTANINATAQRELEKAMSRVPFGKDILDAQFG